MKFLLKNNKINLSIGRKVLLLLFLFFAVMAPSVVFAADQEPTWFASIVGPILGWVGFFIVAIQGYFIELLSKVLITVASFNGFITSTAVSIGWSLVRDVANLFFVVVLLIIAIATILRVEQYHLKKALPKLILMAILVNFSKLICGVIIDAGQIIMMTFVRGFSEISAQGNIIQAFQLQKLIDYNQDGSAELDQWSVIATIWIIVVLLTVTIAVLLVMVMVFVIRIVMLWVLIILSPLPYLLTAWPGRRSQTYYQQWWDQFINYVMIGPVLAFFLWLTFAMTAPADENAAAEDPLNPRMMGDFATIPIEGGIITENKGIDIKQRGSSENVNISALTPRDFFAFVIATAMIMASLMIAQQMGGAAGSIAGSAAGKLRSAGFGAIRKGAGLGALTARKVSSGTVRTAGAGLRGVGSKIQLAGASGKLPVLGKPVGKAISGLGTATGAVGKVMSDPGRAIGNIGKAWQMRKARINKEFDGRSVEQMADVMNRFILFDRKKTTLGLDEKRRQASTVQKDVAGRTNDSGEIFSEIDPYIDKTKSADPRAKGIVRKSDQAEVEGRIRSMASNRDSNEIIPEMLKTDWGKAMAKEEVTDKTGLVRVKDADGNDTNKIDISNPENIKRVFAKLFGDKEGARFARDFSPIAHNAGDVHLQGLAKATESGYEFTDADENADSARSFFGKQEEQAAARMMNPQALYAEGVEFDSTTGKIGDRSFAGLSHLFDADLGANNGASAEAAASFAHKVHQNYGNRNRGDFTKVLEEDIDGDGVIGQQINAAKGKNPKTAEHLSGFIRNSGVGRARKWDDKSQGLDKKKDSDAVPSYLGFQGSGKYGKKENPIPRQFPDNRDAHVAQVEQKLKDKEASSVTKSSDSELRSRAEKLVDRARASSGSLDSAVKKVEDSVTKVKGSKLSGSKEEKIKLVERELKKKEDAGKAITLNDKQRRERAEDIVAKSDKGDLGSDSVAKELVGSIRKNQRPDESKDVANSIGELKDELGQMVNALQDLSANTGDTEAGDLANSLKEIQVQAESSKSNLDNSGDRGFDSKIVEGLLLQISNKLSESDNSNKDSGSNPDDYAV